MKLLQKLIEKVRWYSIDILIVMVAVTASGACFGLKRAAWGLVPASTFLVAIRAVFYFSEGRHRPDRHRGWGD